MTRPPQQRKPLLDGLRLERAQSSSRYRDGRFFNASPRGARLQGSPWPMLGEFFFDRRQRVPPHPLPLVDPRGQWLTKPHSGLRVTWLGHSTLLLELGNRRVLTDPVFGERVSPLRFAGPKRFHAVPVTIAELPPLDAVIISHDHYDHLCFESIRLLGKRDLPFVTSLGVGMRLESWGIPAQRIIELDWWEDYVLPGGDVSLTATPSQHFSGRGLKDRDATAWSGWSIRDDRHRVFFSGDTGLTEDYHEIRTRLGPFDLVMLEIGAFHPTWGTIHLGPANALAAFAMLGGGTLLPVHWGTFNLALHAWDEPAETLLALAAAAGARVLTPQLGAPIEPALCETTPAWWRGLFARS